MSRIIALVTTDGKLPRYLTAGQVAAVHGVGTSTVDRWARAGRIEFVPTSSWRLFPSAQFDGLIAIPGDDLPRVGQRGLPRCDTITRSGPCGRVVGHTGHHLTYPAYERMKAAIRRAKNKKKQALADGTLAQEARKADA